MILIADSGSTKTEWVSVGKNETRVYQQTSGINPFFQNAKEIYDEIKIIKHFQHVDYIHFYGAGCANPQKNKVVEDALLKIFPSATISINCDLLASARSLCGNEKGIVCIMGTGSNSCFYDGKSIVKNISPLGYILGDEGSGAVLGKKFIADLLKNQLSESITKAFFQKYDTNPAEMLDMVYRKPYPNRYLAKYTHFMAENKTDPSIMSIIIQSFKEFFDRNIAQYTQSKTLPISFTGSVAYYFKEELKTVAKKKGYQIKKILKTPLKGLVEYHLGK